MRKTIAGWIIIAALVASIAEADEASDALRALQALRSVTEAGANYRQYSDRALDAKVLVDRYTRAPQGNSSIPTTAVASAMRFYTMAATVWNAKIRRTWYATEFLRALHRDSEGLLCEPFRDVLARLDRQEATRPAPIDSNIVYDRQRMREALEESQRRIAELQRRMPAIAAWQEETDRLLEKIIPTLWSCAVSQIADIERSARTR